MKILKKIAAAAAAVGIGLSMGSCGKAQEQGSDGGLRVITTNFPPFDFVRQISGGECEVEMLLTGGQDSHSYEPTAKDIIRINEADLFICTGGESDSWVEKIADSLDSDLKILRMMDYIEPIEVHDHEEEHSEEEHEEHEEHGAEYDEHVWTSPLNAVKISEAITAALCEADAENAEKYKAGLESYKAELSLLDKDMRAAADSLTKPLIFGDRFPFAYLARDYGIEYYAAFSGCSSETEPSAAKMTELIDRAKETGAKAVYYIEFSTEKVAKTIAEAVGAETRLMHSCHTLSTEDLNAGETYISIMRRNIEAMRE
ncbi:MAG: metal ABC transporter substrate-binding protein [Ruminiclostridium sp.]